MDSSKSTSAAGWTEFVYNPSGRALAPEPASVSGGTATFSFASDIFTALLTTNDKSLIGDLTGKTLSDTIMVSGVSAGATFITQNGGGCGNPPAVRFFFTTPGFEFTNFWWSNPVSYTLANGSATITASLSDPSQWSDFNGKSGTSAPADFAQAVAKVNAVGLSFGGDCFFENGATTSDGSGTLSSTFTE
jgi:hypothetical protein